MIPTGPFGLYLLAAIAGIGLVALLCWGIRVLIDLPDDNAEHAAGSHSWPTPRFLWRTFRGQDWDTPSPHLHGAPGFTIDALPCHLEVHHPRSLPQPEPKATASDHRLGEPHRDWTPRPISPARDGLAPWIEAALAGARTDDTIIDTDHGTFRAWLEAVTGGDPWNGLGSADAWLNRLCHRTAVNA